MLNHIHRRYLPVLALAFAATACGGNTLGALGDILGGAAGQPAGAPEQGQLSAEIEQVDTEDQVILVTTQAGERGGVHYDQNTMVVYQQQQYPVTALEPGDLVVMQVQQDAQGNLYVGRIDVQQSVQDRTGDTSNSEIRRFTGRISQMDAERGQFVLQVQGGAVTVVLPYNPPQATVDYFRRLRNGDTVSLEAIPVATGRVQLYRFL